MGEKKKLIEQILPLVEFYNAETKNGQSDQAATNLDSSEKIKVHCIPETKKIFVLNLLVLRIFSNALSAPKPDKLMSV